MLLGALIDLGFGPEKIKALAQSFKLGRVRFSFSREKRSGIAGVLVRIIPETRQPERNFSEIKKIILKARLPETVKNKSIETFRTLASAEAKVHGTRIEQIHFHELGAVDTIIDIAGVILGFHELGLEEVFASRVRLGSGQVKCQHGLLPVPAPATLELVKGMPVSGGSEADGELATPTGAVLIRALAKGFGAMPEMDVEKIGCGLGERNLETRPNVLRIVSGKTCARTALLVQLETTIDDMNPEFLEPLLNELDGAGALETAILPVQLKKNRPGVILRILSEKSRLDDIIQTVFKHSTTTGVRFFELNRVALPREMDVVKTAFGVVPVKKIILPGGGVRIHPEYEHLRKIARKNKISLLELEQAVKAEWLKKQPRPKN
jgi:hypothetical protein